MSEEKDVLRRSYQTNPLLVCWPGEDLTGYLLRESGGITTAVPMTDTVLAILTEFRQPRRGCDVFAGDSDSVRGALEECLRAELLMPVPPDGSVRSAASSTDEWAGFRFCDTPSAGESPTSTGRVSREFCVGDREVRVLDGVLDPPWIASVHRWFFQLPFRRIDVDSVETSHSRHWLIAFSPVERFVRAVPLFRHLTKIVSDMVNGGLVLRRLNAYSTDCSDLPCVHRDYEGNQGVTAVLYANRTWHGRWAGETVFYEDDGEATHLVMPKPGRVVVFDGNILHRAGIPARDCYEPRFTLVLKFEKVIHKNAG